MAKKQTVGRARLALVAGTDGPGVLSWISVSARWVRRATTRISSPSPFDRSAQRQIRGTVTKLVRAVIAQLGIGQPEFELSVANVGGAAAHGAGIRIEGSSGDVPTFLALLGAALDLPTKPELVATGHIASPGGEIVAVQGLAAKVAAAVADPAVKTFVCPALDTDGSLPAFAPHYQQQTAHALQRAATQLRIIFVRDVAGLILQVFEVDDFLRASLIRGYFEPSWPATCDRTPLALVLDQLRRDGDLRFWRALEHRLASGDAEAAAELLRLRMQLQVARKQYPSGFGSELLALLAALDPLIRRRIRFPIVPLESCLQVARFVLAGDEEDVQHLVEATQIGPRADRPKLTVPSRADPGSADTGNSTLAIVLHELDLETITRRLANPIDEARGRFRLSTIHVDSADEFVDRIAAFTRQLLRSAGVRGTAGESQAFVDEAIQLVERAFAEEGGYDAALFEGLQGPRGGMRYVLDQMTLQFKRAAIETHANGVLKSALDPLDWPTRVRFVAALQQRIAPLLPESLRQLPAERLARRHELLVRSLVDSTDRLKQILRTL